MKRSLEREPSSRSGATVAPLSATLLLLMAGAGDAQVFGTTVQLEITQDTTHGFVFSRLGDGTDDFLFDAEDVWSLTLIDTGTGATLPPILPSNSSFACTLTTEAGNDSKFLFEWKDLTNPGIPGATVYVAMYVEILPDDYAFQIQSGVLLAGSGLAIYSLDAPRTQVQQRGDPAGQILAIPMSGGNLIPDPIHNNIVANGQLTIRENRVYPGRLSMQYASYYNALDEDGINLFVGARDPNGYIKQFIHETVAGTSLLQTVRHYPENNTTTATLYFTPYSSVLGLVHGDWYDASIAYRGWATEQAWVSKGRIRDNGSISTTVKQADMYGPIIIGSCPEELGECGESPNENFDRSTLQYWSSIVEEQKATFGVDKILSHVYGWDYNGWDANWGEWLDPSDGLPIDEFIAAAAQAGIDGNKYAQYFYNGRYSPMAPGYAATYVPGYVGSVEQFANLNPDGSLLTENQQRAFKKGPCGVPATCVVQDELLLDTGASFSLDFTKLVCDLLAQFGSSGVYLDVFSIEPLPLTYNAALGRAGGGSSYSQGQVGLVRDLKDYMRNSAPILVPQFYVLSEAVDERFVNELDYTYENGSFPSAINLTGDSAYRAPLFETVYGDYQIVAPVLQAHVPPGTAALQTPGIGCWGRNLYASMLFQGVEPYAGRPSRRPPWRRTPLPAAATRAS